MLQRGSSVPGQVLALSPPQLEEGKQEQEVVGESSRSVVTRAR